MMNNDLPQVIALSPSRTRIEFLDALRGIAILIVFLFHSFSRWPEIVPYKNQFADVPVFHFGWLGVQLFFLISGFVIFMTLEKSVGPADFLKRRWLRLFPAMLICSLLVYTTSPLFPLRPAGVIQLRDLLPGLTFMEPLWWGKILGSPQGLIEGAFWSLFVEVKFYIVACFVYFVLGRNKLIFILGIIFLMGYGLEHIPPIAESGLRYELTSMKQFGWFAAGAFFYKYFHERRKILFFYALGISLAAAIAEGEQHMGVGAGVVAILIACFFASAVYFPFMQRMLEIKPLLLMGFVSYPFYLIHENMSVSMIVQLGKAAPWIPSLALPLLPMCVVLAVAYTIAIYIEPTLRTALRAIGQKTLYVPAAK
jgi:peptidoglycan/LPS O-acetylase OafA/YrhL